MRVVIEIIERYDGTWSVERLDEEDEHGKAERDEGLSLDAAIELVTETMRHE